MEPCPAVSGYRFGLNTVAEFLVPETSEPVYIFPDKWDNYHRMVDWQIARLSRILEQHCIPVLRGQFSRWEEMHEFMEKKAWGKYGAATSISPMQITSQEAFEVVQREIERRRRKTEDTT